MGWRYALDMQVRIEEWLFRIILRITSCINARAVPVGICGFQSRVRGSNEYHWAIVIRLRLTIWHRHIGYLLGHESQALAEAGLSVTRKSFDMIAREFIESIMLAVHRGDKAEYHARQYPPIVTNYFIGFFAGKQMNAIKAADIENYWDWRRDYWTTGPGSENPYIRYDRIINGRKTSIRRPVKEGTPSESTLRKEALLLKQLFEFGQRRGYTLDIPAIEVPKSNKRGTKSRPGFTLVEFLHLMEVSKARVKQFELGGADPSGKNQRVYSDRMKLHCFCMIAGFTGMRPTELFIPVNN